MTTSIDLTPAEIRKEGWEALISQMGVAKSLRFLLEYEKGQGNYTELRKELFAGQTVHDILEDVANEGIISAVSRTPEAVSGKSGTEKGPERDSSA